MKKINYKFNISLLDRIICEHTNEQILTIENNFYQKLSDNHNQLYKKIIILIKNKTISETHKKKILLNYYKILINV